MLRLICNRISIVKSRALPFNHGFSFLRPMSEISNFTDPQSFTLSYLQNSSGLSSVSKKLLIENSEKADSVLKLMRTHGLTQTQIEKIIGTRPALLLAALEDKLRRNMELLESLGFSGASLGKVLSREPRLLHSSIDDKVEFLKAHGFSDKQIRYLIMGRPPVLMFNVNKIFKPKLDFLKSMGFTDGDVAKILSFQPYILGRSLENYIIPCFRLLRRLLGTKENVLKVLNADNKILKYDLEKILEPNILIFKNHGVPESLILKMFMIYPGTLILSPQRITENLVKVLNIGFDPTTMPFILAFRTMAFIRKTLWQRRLEVYKSFGWSEEQVHSAFKKQPLYIRTSEEKIKKMMNFFINKLNIEPSVICRYPNLLTYSLEKRIIPRCSVLQLLMSKGFVKEDVKVFKYFTMTEEKFVKELVTRYQQVVPVIVKAHEGKIEFQGFAASL